ncbi:MAG: putative O-glycosylation ligase, exosortase A system-associated [Hydrogenophilales bacterium 28-61-23]|nr:MAG: putative O-glycosylation ligase, exosortase A system-associated [Hydrogenophilales bacterium 28-61-23]
MRDLLIAAVVFGLLPMVLRRPQVGIYLWCWISYMNPHRLAYGFAMTFPWAYFIAIATFAGMFFTKEPKRIIWTRETILMLTLLGWAFITTMFAFYPDEAWEGWVKFFKIMLMTFVTIMVITNRERLQGVVWMIALSLGFFGIKGGIFTIAKGGVYNVMGPEGSFIGGNNEMALALVMTVPLIAYLRIQETRHWMKVGLTGAMLLTTIAAVGSQSRGALVGLLAMGFFLWIKSRNKLMTALLIIITVGSIGAIMPQAWYDRMATTQEYAQDDSALGRINAWHTAFNVAKDRITGGGIEMFRAGVFRQYAPEPNRVHDVHSVYFEMMGEHGFIGFGLYMTIMAFAWMKGSSIIRRTKRIPDLKWAGDLAAMTQVSMIGFATCGAFLGLSYFDFYWHLVAIMVILNHLVAQQIANAVTQGVGKSTKKTANVRATVGNAA